MSYRLDPAMPMSEALRRVAFAELEIAHGALATPPERHSGVHSARKCLKRLRSLLLLVAARHARARLRHFDRSARRHRPWACAGARRRRPDRRRRQARTGDRSRTGLGPDPILARLAPEAAARGGAESGAERRVRRHARPCSSSGRPSPASPSIPTISARSPRASGAAIARPASRSSTPSPPTATRMCMNGAKACSIIGGRCSCSPRAGRRSFRRGPRPPGRCRRSSATTTTSPCSAGSCPRRP